MRPFIFTLPSILSLSLARHVCSNTHLQVDVYHAPETPVPYQNTTLLFSPTAFTLISSAHEAVLVDAPTLTAGAKALASWIATTIPGKNLKYIYITHAHVDHFGAFPAILDKFPDAKVVATKGVKTYMPAQYEEPLWSGFWKPLFPSLIKANLDLVSELEDNKFALENGKHEFRAIEVGGGDTADSTVLHVPDIGLVVGGDVVYGHCYQYLAENPTREDRKEWLKSLNEVRDLRPKWVVPSHVQADEDFGAHHIKETEDYIETWDRWLASGQVGSWQDLEASAKKRWPDRIGSFILRYTAQSFFNATF